MMRGQRGMALVIAFITILVMALMAHVITYIIVKELFGMRRERDLTGALFIAKAGANKAVRQLQKDNSDTSSITGSLLNGTYQVTIDGTSKLIESIGTVHNRSQTVIIAYGTSGSSGGPGDAFDYGIFTDGKQHYKGGGNPSIPVVSNASVHSNNTGWPDDTWPQINNPSHDIVDEPTYSVSKGPPAITFPTLNIRYDSATPGLHYYKDDLEISNDYWHTATNGGSDNHYYHDFEDTKASPSLSATMPSSPSLPASGGVTLVIYNGSTPPTLDIGSGSSTYQGTLIIIGANASISGNITFNGLIFVKKNNSGYGGELTISGSPDIYGAVIATSLDASAGTPRVYYTPSYFKDSTKGGDKEGYLNTFSWQAEF